MLKDADRFFARLREFDLECPDCGEVSRVRSDDRDEEFHLGSGLFACGGCGLDLQLGIVAWRPSLDALAAIERDPDDPAIIARIRALGGGWFFRGEHQRCTCNVESARQVRPIARQRATRTGTRSGLSRDCFRGAPK